MKTPRQRRHYRMFVSHIVFQFDSEAIMTIKHQKGLFRSLVYQRIVELTLLQGKNM